VLSFTDADEDEQPGAEQTTAEYRVSHHTLNSSSPIGTSVSGGVKLHRIGG
jgi:hypothetical protein